MTPEPENAVHGYELAYRLAAEQLSGVKDLELLCRNSGARPETTGDRLFIVLEYLGKTYRIKHPEVEIFPVEGSTPVPLRDKLLMLHYLNRANGTPLSGRLITYQELPEGIAYAGNFKKRAIKPLLEAFGSRMELMLQAGERLFGAARSDAGDVSVVINAFPRLPVTLVLWQGDEELAADGNILFDSSIPGYLSPEDITVLCETITRALSHFTKD